MGRPEVRESDHDAAWGFEEMGRLFTEYRSLPDLSEVAIQAGSLFEADGAIQNYGPPADQMLGLLGVAADHLDAFQRMLEDENGGLPAMAGYTLMRAAIEAAATAIWLRCSGKTDVRVVWSLWMVVNGREAIEPLSVKLGIPSPVGYKRMRSRVDGIIGSRRGLTAEKLQRHHTKTSIINEADKHVRRRELSALIAWQACSGLTHANRSSILLMLERERLYQQGTRTTFRITAGAMVTAEVLFATVECMKVATRIYLEQAAPMKPSHPR